MDSKQGRIKADGSQHLPANISVPFVHVSTHLGLPPYPNLAGQNLWNYKLLDLSEPLEDADNLSAQFTFTGTDDESWFFVVLTAIEARAAPVIPLALKAFEAASAGESSDVTESLHRIAHQLQGLSKALLRMYERCNPQIFYSRVRQFLAGCKSSSELPNGIFYDDEHGGGSWRQYNGPSAAQSSLWQFIDLALGVVHYPTGTGRSVGDVVVEKSALSGKSPEFLEVGGT